MSKELDAAMNKLERRNKLVQALAKDHPTLLIILDEYADLVTEAENRGIKRALESIQLPLGGLAKYWEKYTLERQIGVRLAIDDCRAAITKLLKEKE